MEALVPLEDVPVVVTPTRVLFPFPTAVLVMLCVVSGPEVVVSDVVIPARVEWDILLLVVDNLVEVVAATGWEVVTVIGRVEEAVV